jgi:release factor H-coupled RctB family protein
MPPCISWINFTMGNSKSVDGRAPVHLFASSNAWIEGNSSRQLETLSQLPGLRQVAAMPDLHPGKYGPVGCAMLADTIHPAFVGSDIGCGMGLYQLNMDAKSIRAEKAAVRLRVLGEPWDGDPHAHIADAALAPTPFDASLGSIGGGNHFCELQAAAEIIDRDAAARVGLDIHAAFVLVHSGSRGLGYSILEPLLAHGTPTLDPLSSAGQAYLRAHHDAVAWARLNRRVIAARAARALRADIRLISDIAHNMLEVTDRGVLHRKGAAAADRGLVAVPGSRDQLSYLVEPIGALRPETLASIAHGAGRKYDRSSMHGRVATKKSDLQRLARNQFGGVVVCEDRNMLIEEAPDAYKSIDRVIDDLVRFELARVVATFRPIVTFKSTVEPENRARTRHRDKDFVDKRNREDWR